MDENSALGHLTGVEGALYNEIDAYAAAWLRNLIAAGKIEPGRVSERDIRVLPTAFLPARAHFFAGIGGWPLALDLAGWPRDLPVWTGSCPCQPFSAAGRKKGFDDDRHLWPAWFRLINAHRPPVVFGEQVASPDGLKWLDLVRVDLERAGYSVGGADLCAAGAGAPHIRQRLYFVGLAGGGLGDSGGARGWGDAGADDGAKSTGAGDREPQGLEDRRRGDVAQSPSAAYGCAVVDAAREQVGLPGRPRESRASFWARADWIACVDGKQRPVEPGTFPLAHGVPGRVGKLRAYGNAIVPPLAAEFVQGVMDVLGIAPADSVR